MPPPRDHPSAPHPEGEPAPQSPDPPLRPVRSRRRRWPWFAAGGALLALVLFLALFDWNLLRGPLERYASRSMAREVTVGHLDVRFRGLTPRLVLSDVTLGNPDWLQRQPMGRARELEFSVRLLSLLTSEIIVPHLRLTDAEVGFVRNAEGRANWKFRERDEAGKRNVQVLTLTLENARVSYRDAVQDISADLRAASRSEGPYETRLQFVGKWRGAPFEGTADTGSVLSLRGSTRPFPMRIAGSAGKTRVRAEGEVADITRFRHIDADFAISGPSLATLYPSLKLALPETPPYQARGRLKRTDDLYAYEDFKGTIGASDVAGSARYELRDPRPLLTAELASERLNIADLGPLIGVPSGGDAAAPAAAEAPRPKTGRVIPDSQFNLEKLQSMDADVRLSAGRLGLPGQDLPLRDVAARAHVANGVLTLDPLDFGFAGGEVEARIVLNAGMNPLAGEIAVDFSRVRLSQLLPEQKQLEKSRGLLGAQVRLKGRGNSVADLLGSSDGSVTVAMAGGRVSELAVWLVNLHGGELIPLLFGGDKPTPIRCAAAALNVEDGTGKIGLFVFDTEESRIGAEGSIDLGDERVNVTLHPRSKKPGLLSLRGPVHITGSFRDLDFKPGAQTIARGIGALALGLVNPLLALVPLVETGPGEDAPCRSLLSEVKGAVAESGKSVQAAPPDAGAGGKAPIVDVPAGKAAASARQRERTVGQDQQTGADAPIVDINPRNRDAPRDRQTPAPVVDVPPKK